jgi:hypothetical protein
VKNLNEFLTSMRVYRGLFDSPEDLKNYYGLYLGGVYTALSPIVRSVFQKIGYDVLVPRLNPVQHDRFVVVSGRKCEIDYTKICRYIPSDFVLSFADGFYGTRLTGSFLITDLIELDSWDMLTLVGREAIFHQMLVNYVVCSNLDNEDENIAIKKMHAFFLRNRTSEDITVMAKCYIVKEFLKSMAYLPAEMKTAYSDNATYALECRMKVMLVAFRVIYVEDTLFCDHSFNNITDAYGYKKFFDQFTEVDPPLLRQFVQDFRLDT